MRGHMLLILVVRIAIARYATDLGREMRLLLGTLVVMRLRRCIASHRRCYVTSAVNRVLVLSNLPC